MILKCYSTYIYPYKIYVCINPDYKKLKTEFKYIEELKENAIANVISTGDKNNNQCSLIQIKNKHIGQNDIAHEAVHVAFDIFEYCGCKVNFDNQEPFTYLVGFIVNCINETLKIKEI